MKQQRICKEAWLKRRLQNRAGGDFQMASCREPLLSVTELSRRQKSRGTKLGHARA
jgi:hypothetical protein